MPVVRNAYTRFRPGCVSDQVSRTALAGAHLSLCRGAPSCTPLRRPAATTVFTSLEPRRASLHTIGTITVSSVTRTGVRATVIMGLGGVQSEPVLHPQGQAPQRGHHLLQRHRHLQPHARTSTVSGVKTQGLVYGMLTPQNAAPALYLLRLLTTSGAGAIHSART
jgi:hypothetical protein